MKLRYKISIILLLFLTITACNKKNKGSEINKAITWEYYSSMESYTHPKIKDELERLDVDEQCQVVIELLFPSTEKEKYKPLTKDLQDFLLDRFFSYEDAEMPFEETDDPQEYVDRFAHYILHSFKEDVEEMISSGYLENEVSLAGTLVKEFYVRDSIMYNDNGIISIGYSNYEYSGGAHGISVFLARSYDLMNGSPITPSTLFQDLTSYKILEAIEQQLLTDYDVANVDELQEQTGIFSLTGSKVVMSNEFYFSEKGITFYYNQYEIAPYAFGPTEVTVPYSVLAPYFRPQYQFLANL